MSVLSIATDDRFIIRVVKAHHDNPSDQWANSYEFVAVGDAATADLLNLGLVVVAFEKAIHKNVTDFKRLSISTWEADSVPYDPTAFISTTLTDTGSVGVVGGVEPINACLNVTRVPATGRFGHIFYRNVLDSADVFSPGGRASLVDADGTNDTIQAAITSSGLDDYLGAAASETFCMALINKTGTQVRRVQGLFAAGVSYLPLDHAWFNRTPAGP